MNKKFEDAFDNEDLSPEVEWAAAIGVSWNGRWSMKIPPIERDKVPREVLLLFAMLNKAETDEDWGDALIDETFDE